MKAAVFFKYAWPFSGDRTLICIAEIKKNWVSENIWDVLRDLVLFVKFKKREKYLRRCVTFNEVPDENLQLK